MPPIQGGGDLTALLSELGCTKYQGILEQEAPSQSCYVESNGVVCGIMEHVFSSL